MRKSQKIYLAGPDVFLKDAEDQFIRKKAICEKYGHQGFSPLDNDLILDGLKKSTAAQKIFQNNEDLMRQCDCIVANITPFRGISADAGTIYEIGFMRGLGKSLYAYSNHPLNLVERTKDSPYFNGQTGLDIRGNEVEDFDLVDNLMIPGGIAASGGKIVVATLECADLDRDLTAFEQAVSLITESST